jgi:hypothetical protein
MKMALLVSTMIFASPSVFAYQDGTYNCDARNGGQVTEVIKTVTIASGLTLPYVEETSYINDAPRVKKGYATVTSEGKVEIIEIDGGEVLSYDKDGNLGAGCFKVK